MLDLPDRLWPMLVYADNGSQPRDCWKYQPGLPQWMHLFGRNSRQCQYVSDAASIPHVDELPLSWLSGDASGTATSVSVTMNSNKSVTAVYVCKETEPNDGSLSATAVPLVAPCNGLTSGILATTADVDWFDEGETVPPGITVRFDLSVPSAADFDLELYGPDPGCPAGQTRCLLDFSSTVGNGGTESVSFTTRATGFFAARIVRYRGPTSSSYYSLRYLR